MENDLKYVMIHTAHISKYCPWFDWCQGIAHHCASQRACGTTPGFMCDTHGADAVIIGPRCLASFMTNLRTYCMLIHLCPLLHACLQGSCHNYPPTPADARGSAQGKKRYCTTTTTPTPIPTPTPTTTMQAAAGSRQHQSCSSSTSTPAGEGACSVSVLHCHGVLVWRRAVFSTGGLAKDYF